MFRPAPMVRVSAVVLERDERNVLRTLGRLGVIQLTRAQAGPDAESLVARDYRHELARCHRLATRTQELRRLLEMENDSGATASVAEMPLAQAEERIFRIENSAGNLLNQRRLLVERLAELQAVAGRLADYRGLEIPLDQPDESSFLHFVTGSLPPENLTRLQNEIGGDIALLPLPERNGRQPLIAVTTRQVRPVLDNMLRQAGFEREELPAIHGATVDTLSGDNQHEQEKLGAQLKQADAELQALAGNFASPLAEIESAVETERRLLEAGENFSRTERAVLVTGWVPDVEAPELENCLREITGGHCVVEIAAARDSDEEQIPILLRPPRWLRPFEMLVTAYGLPQYRELEPTLFVAVSYVLMFGAMFGDAGQGAVLALGGLLAVWRSRKKKVRDLGLLFLFAGLASSFFGCLYGSFFGLPAFKRFALWHDPIESNPLNLMTGAIGVGVGMISLGLVLNVINRWRHGDFLAGLLGKFGVAGVVFYWGSLMLLTQYAAIESRGLVIPAVIVFLALPVAGWIFEKPVEWLCQRRAGKTGEPGGNLPAAFSESLCGAFEAVLSYFANTVSFVRLAAYAMSHAALLMAVFLMADVVKHVSPAGGFLGVLVIVLGNAVAILLEGVIASVQALRLEYYEFFGKFFSGGGRPFKPFCLPTKTVADAPP